MAETVRFELTVLITQYDRLATCCFRPLSHISIIYRYLFKYAIKVYQLKYLNVMTLLKL